MNDSTANLEPDPEKQRVVMIGIEGFPRLVRWVQEGATLEERQRRGKIAHQAKQDLLSGVDHEAINKALRAEAKRQSQGDPR
jgi:hypothetical protein